MDAIGAGRQQSPPCILLCASSVMIRAVARGFLLLMMVVAARADTLDEAVAALGPELPIVATNDFHANISDRLVALTTALVVYKTNPHVDQRARGYQNSDE